MNFALIGFYSKQNFGDNLMQKMLTDFLSGYGSVTVYSDCNHGVKHGKEDLSYLNSDTIVIGGGSLIYPDFWVFENLAHPSIVFLNVNVPKIENENFAQKLQSLKATWFVRDTQSVINLKEIGISSFYAPDICTNLKFKTNVIPKKMCVFLNSYIFNDLFSDCVDLHLLAQKNILELAKYLNWMITFGWKIHLISCQTQGEIDDRIVSGVLYQYIKDKSCCDLSMCILDDEEIIKHICESDFVISSRLHSTLLCATLGIKFIDITHDDKNKMFLKDNNLLDNSVDYYFFNKDLLISKTQSIENSEIKNNIQKNAKENWKSFVYLWDNWFANEN
jgi:polysaccharide pyruvyl transferase WcaK-like protein